MTTEIRSAILSEIHKDYASNPIIVENQAVRLSDGNYLNIDRLELLSIPDGKMPSDNDPSKMPNYHNELIKFDVGLTNADGEAIDYDFENIKDWIEMNC